MSRLPKIGGDENTWGQVLNDFLSQSHNTDGTIRDDAIAHKVATATAILPGAGLVGGGDLTANRTLSVNFGTIAGTVAAGNDMRLTGALQASNNLSELISPTIARDNLNVAQALSPTSVKTSTYTAAAGELVPVDVSGGSVTITLPTAPHDKTRVSVKLINLGGTTNVVTIAAGGGDAFNKTGGPTSWTLTMADQSVGLQYNVSAALWYVHDGLSLPQLDARYATAPLTFNIKDYGAPTDGSSDSLTAIQAAINAAQTAGGGTVFIPKGTFMVSGTPQITGSNIIVQGAGAASKIVLGSASMRADGKTIGLWVNGGNNVLIQNLYIDGNFANIAKNGTYQATNTLWAPTLAKYGTQSVKNYIYASTGVDSSTYLTYRCPIRITDSSDVTVQNCVIKNSVSAGILIDGTAVDSTQNVLIRNNRLSYIWDNAIYFHKGVRYGSAIGNHCSDTQYAGVTAIYCNDILIANNIVHDTGPSQSDSAGVELCGVNVGSVTGNVIYNCLFMGVELKTTNEDNITNGASGKYVRNVNVQVHGNYIHDCNNPGFPSSNASGVNFFGTDNTTVSGNKIERCDIGISVSSLAAGAYIKGNTIRGNKVMGIAVGNSADVFNAEIDGNTIENNSGDGINCYAPVKVLNNIIRANGAEGVNILSVPSGLPYKTDLVANNLFADNTNNGVRVASGAGNPAVIRSNLFQNSDMLTFYDGMTIVGTILTSASASFAASDVGSTVVLMGVGDANGGATLTTTITAFTSSTTVTLAAAASVARSGVAFQLYRPKGVFYDGVMVSGNPQLTSATANFTSNDVGKSVTIYQTDGPNPSALGTYTITSFTDGQHVNLTASPTNRSNILFVIRRGLGRQQRAVFVANSSDIEFVKNRSYCMRTENYNNSSLSAASFVSDNFDFGSVVSNTPALLSAYRPVATKTGASVFPSQTKDEVLLCNATSNSMTVFLPSTADVGSGRVYIIKKTDSSANTVTVATGNTQTIDGATSFALASQYSVATVVCDGSNWQKI